MYAKLYAAIYQFSSSVYYYCSLNVDYLFRYIHNIYFMRLCACVRFLMMATSLLTFGHHKYVFCQNEASHLPCTDKLQISRTSRASRKQSFAMTQKAARHICMNKHTRNSFRTKFELFVHNFDDTLIPRNEQEENSTKIRV